MSGTSTPTAAYTWYTREGATTVDGQVDGTQHAQVLIDRAKHLQLRDRLGPKRHAILLDLIILSERDPETGQRIVIGSIPEIAKLIVGARTESGYGADSITALLRDLEAEQLLTHHQGRPLGRNKGATKSYWTLAEALFAPVVGIPQTPSGMAPGFTDPQTPDPSPAAPQVSDPENPRAIPQQETPAQNGSGPSGAAEPDLQHEMYAMNSHTFHVDPAIRRALLQQLTDLNYFGADKVLDRVDPAIIAAWLEYMRGRDLNGGFLRTKLESGDGLQRPPGFTPGTRVALDEHGQLVLLTADPFPTAADWCGACESPTRRIVIAPGPDGRPQARRCPACHPAMSGRS